jgi:ATP-dependent DNA helicase RecG
MSYNSQDILQLIKQEENNAVEFKSSEVHADSLAREMTAFSNSSGGVILIGVDDEGVIEGLTPT